MQQTILIRWSEILLCYDLFLYSTGTLNQVVLICICSLIQCDDVVNLSQEEEEKKEKKRIRISIQLGDMILN